MATKVLVNTGSGNGLLPDGTKPLPEQYWLISSEVLLIIHLGNFRGSAEDIYPWYEFEND